MVLGTADAESAGPRRETEGIIDAGADRQAHRRGFERQPGTSSWRLSRCRSACVIVFLSPLLHDTHFAQPDLEANALNIVKPDWKTYRHKVADMMIIQEQSPARVVSHLQSCSMAVLVVGKTLEVVHDQVRDFMERPGGGEEWSETHHSPFSADKFGLVNFAPKLSIKRKKLGPTLQLRAHNVEPSPYHRFLGVLVDCEMRHHPHVAEACAKGAAWAALMRRMGQSRHGMPMKVLLRLYQSVAVPRILYAADTFLAPIRTVEGRRAKTGSVGHIKKLAQVQRQAVIIITGAMRTAATDALEAHLRVLPMDLLVDRYCFRATARLCSLPDTHPLYPHIKKASVAVQSHRSKMHELLVLYAPRVSQDHMEKITATALGAGAPDRHRGLEG